MKLLVINHKEGDESHCILQGEVLDRNSLIKVQKVNPKLETSLEDLELVDRQQTLKVNFSHCFLKDKLYLFWPQEWDIRQEVRRKLLGLDYHPPHISFMIRVQYNLQEKCYVMEQLRWKDSSENGAIRMTPKRGCTAAEFGDNKFYIFGGIYD